MKNPKGIVCTSMYHAEPWLNENAESFRRHTMQGTTYSGEDFVLLILYDRRAIDRYTGLVFSSLEYIGPIEPPEEEKQRLGVMVR